MKFLHLIRLNDQYVVSLDRLEEVYFNEENKGCLMVKMKDDVRFCSDEGSFVSFLSFLVNDETLFAFKEKEE